MNDIRGRLVKGTDLLSTVTYGKGESATAVLVDATEMGAHHVWPVQGSAERPSDDWVRISLTTAMREYEDTPIVGAELVTRMTRNDALRFAQRIVAACVGDTV